MMTTLRLWNNQGENGGEWFCDPADSKKLAQAKALLAEYQALEPEAGWRLESRGTVAHWHPCQF